MVSWTCPYCNESMHSAWDSRNDEAVVCISCDGTFKNKYYEGEAPHEKRMASNLKHH